MPLSEEILKKIKQSSGTVDLSKQNITDSDVSELCIMLASRRDIISLNLKHNLISPVGAAILAKNKTLQILYLYNGNRLKIEDLEPFLHNTTLVSFPIVGGQSELLTKLRAHIKNNAQRKQMGIVTQPVGLEQAPASITSEPGSAIIHTPPHRKNAVSSPSLKKSNIFTPEQMKELFHIFIDQQNRAKSLELCIIDTEDGWNEVSSILQKYTTDTQWENGNLPIFLPILYKKHWMAIVMGYFKLPAPTFYFYDALGEPIPALLKHSLDKMITTYSTRQMASKKLQYSISQDDDLWLLILVLKFKELNAGQIIDNLALWREMFCAALFKKSILISLNENHQNEYLFLESYDGSEYRIGNSAVNSSGDCYHMFFWTLLNDALGFKKIPMVFLYDTADIKSQTDRAIGLFRLLTYGDLVNQADTSYTNCYQPSVRLSILQKHVKQLNSRHLLIDQKATTALIAKAFHQFGFEATTQLVRRKLYKCLQEAKVTYSKEIDMVWLWAIAEFKKIEAYFGNSRGVIISHRVASGSNPNQNVGEQSLAHLEKILDERGIKYWYFETGSNPTQSPLSNQTQLFDYGKPSWDENGLNKLRHILLLFELTKLERLVGIIGNTSGTLDIAAFLNHRVYCIHNFSAGQYFDNQAYRILLQLQFMQIGLPLQSAPAIDDTAEKMLKNWLDNKPCEPEMPVVSGSTVGIPSCRDDHSYETHKDRMPFSGCLTWETQKKQGQECYGRKVAIESEPLYYPYSWFRSMDNELKQKYTQAVLNKNVRPRR